MWRGRCSLLLRTDDGGGGGWRRVVRGGIDPGSPE